MGFIAGLQGDPRQVQADHTQVVATLVDHLSLLLVDSKEAAATHRRLERAGDFHHLIVIEDVRIHALGGTLQGQTLDVIVGIAGLMIQTILDGKHQLGEDGRFPVLAQT